MSNNQWDEFDDETYGDEGEGPKALRDALKKEQKERKQLEEKLASLQKSSRERTLKEILNSNGVNPAIAKFIPSYVDDESSVNEWLVENASIFNFNLGNGISNHWSYIDNTVRYDGAGGFNNERHIFLLNYKRSNGDWAT